MKPIPEDNIRNPSLDLPPGAYICKFAYKCVCVCIANFMLLHVYWVLRIEGRASGVQAQGLRETGEMGAEHRAGNKCCAAMPCHLCHHLSLLGLGLARNQRAGTAEALLSCGLHSL